MGLHFPTTLLLHTFYRQKENAMKRLLTAFLLFVLLFCLCACDDVNTEIAQTDNADQATLGKVESTTHIETEAAPYPSMFPSEVPTTAPTTEPPHIHSFKAATCTAPKTCKSCGETEGTANGHRWEDATYTSPKKCSVCDATEGEPLEVPKKENYHGHVYTGGSSSKKYHYEANCAGKNSHEITWEEVTRRNLGPCGTCVLK